MVRETRGANKSRMRRFTVSIEDSAYTELKRIAESQRPPLSLQFAVRFALQRFIDENRGKQLPLGLT